MVFKQPEILKALEYNLQCGLKVNADFAGGAAQREPSVVFCPTDRSFPLKSSFQGELSVRVTTVMNLKKKD